ncbi:MAG: hypothetical protein WD468_08475 [Pirellulales bacterium]
MTTALKPFVMRRPRIGLYVGAMEWYWTMTGMGELRDAVSQDALRLKRLLGEQGVDVVDVGVVSSHVESAAAGRRLRDEKVDLVVVYHGTYVDDRMTYAFLEEYGPGPLVLLHTQGVDGIPLDFSLIDYARCWGNNSVVQIISSMKRMVPDRRIGYVFGRMDRAVSEVAVYARAAKALKNVRGCKVAYLPHRCNDAPMYDIFPDDTAMMSCSGVQISFAYIHELEDEMRQVSASDEESLLNDVRRNYALKEPSLDELRIAVRQAIALERVVARHQLDAVAVDAFPELVYRTHQIPNLGMCRLIDQNIVVACEGDLTAMVGGLFLRELSGSPPHFWEHLMFDVEQNWILGGHDGGSAGFNMAADAKTIALRNMMYISYNNSPPAPPQGVVPEFILKPGRVTWLNLFRDPSQGYVMRIATGESVSTAQRPVHHEHLVFKPDVPLEQYFSRMMAVGVDHHFAFAYGDWSRELERLAELLQIPFENLTTS